MKSRKSCLIALNVLNLSICIPPFHGYSLPCMLAMSQFTTMNLKHRLGLLRSPTRLYVVQSSLCASNGLLSVRMIPNCASITTIPPRRSRLLTTTLTTSDTSWFTLLYPTYSRAQTTTRLRCLIGTRAGLRSTLFKIMSTISCSSPSIPRTHPCLPLHPSTKRLKFGLLVHKSPQPTTHLSATMLASIVLTFQKTNKNLTWSPVMILVS